MALRGPLFRLLRTQFSTTCLQSRAQSVAILGAPFSKGQKRRGVEHGPKVIRDAGLIERLSTLEEHYTSIEAHIARRAPNTADHIACLLQRSCPNRGGIVLVYTLHCAEEGQNHTDCPFHDFGDLSFHHLEQDEPYMQVPFPRTVGRANKLLSSAVSSAVGSGHTCVMLGGDHSLAIGTVEGHARQCPDLCLIWVDAHADVNTPLTSPSGNLHGQSVAFMLRELQDKMPDMPGFSWMKPFLSVRDLVYIGLRDVDPGEHYILKNLGIQYFSMRDIDRLGIQRVMEETFDHLLARKRRPIHLSFDIDAFDPSLAPATGTPVNGGLTYREGIYITEEIHNTGLLSAMDLVEVNPGQGASREAVEATATLAVDVIASSLGQTREGSHVTLHEIPSPKDTEQLCL